MCDDRIHAQCLKNSGNMYIYVFKRSKDANTFFGKKEDTNTTHSRLFVLCPYKEKLKREIIHHTLGTLRGDRIPFMEFASNILTFLLLPH